MKIRTNIKAGGIAGGIDGCNHNENIASDKKTKSLTVKSGVKAGDQQNQHNEKLAGDNKRKSFTVKTGIKAGEGDTPIIRGTGK
jgi:hypothetical protein